MPRYEKRNSRLLKLTFQGKADTTTTGNCPINSYAKIMKKILILIVTIAALNALSGCSSPEEKARIEYKNALQLNQNQADAWYGLALILARISNSQRNSTS